MKRIIRGALLCAAIVTAGIVSAQKSKDMSVARGLNTFSSIVKELEMNYVDTINSETAFKDAIDAMLQTVDPYTVYYPKEDREDISQMTTGEYAGIGALLLYKVDTVDVSKFTVDKVSKLLRGRPDTQVRIRVQRPYVQDSILNLTVTRAKIRNSSVPYAGVLPDSIGYIRITQFIEDTGKDVRAALDSFHAAPGLKGVIIDLRGNGGGLLEQAVDVASNFVPKGTEIVRTIGRDKDATKIYKTMRKPLYPDMPVAVLTDGGTASASEILAGAMQDLDRGVLVGTRSFGKGLVQTTRPLPYGGVLKVTVAKYYTPSGRLIQSLDYKHRNPDGSAARVPDSLTHAYKTLHGRTIRDGGGLQPDSTVNWKKVNRLVYNVVSDNWSWDFANKFKATHSTIPTADKFVITDSVYNEFKAFIDPKKFKYDSAMEEATEALRKVADEEGYINDETTAAFDSLKKLLTHNLDRDLDTHRKHIEEYLGGEIVSRYYFDRGRTQYGIRDDEGVDAARGILKDKALYKRILSGK